MKKITGYIHSLLILLLVVSCNETTDYFTLESPIDQMHLEASADNLVLEKVDETKEVITFNWNEATDRNIDSDLVYYFRMYHAEMNNLQSELIRVGKDTYSLSLTVRELNNVLKAWQVIPGDVATIEAEVLAVAEDAPQYLKPEISTTQFNVVGYDPSNKLYLTIESTNGQKRNVEMNNLGGDIYNWKGELNECNFWFVRNSEKGFPAYMKGENENSIIYSSEGEGEKFEADRLGAYDITVYLADETVDITMSPINRLYLITSKDGIETVTSLSEFDQGTDIYYLRNEFEEGTTFRFVRNEDVTWPAYVPGIDETTLETKDEGAQMFSVNKTATYVMTVNMNDLSLLFLDVYVSPTGVIAVVGDAITDAQWDAGRAVNNCSLTQKDIINHPEIISYTGSFEYHSSGTENSFKFVGNPYWGDGLFAEIANANPFNENEQGVTTDGSGDRKWRLPDNFENGIYKLEMNLHTMKISLIKQ
nr:SusE domain-containing protein [uncultured Carboxylicivirga sp.]